MKKAFTLIEMIIILIIFWIWSMVITNMYTTFLQLKHRADWLQLSNSMIDNISNINSYLKNNFEHCDYKTLTKVECKNKKNADIYSFLIEKAGRWQVLTENFSWTKIVLLQVPYAISYKTPLKIEYKQYSDVLTSISLMLMNNNKYMIFFPYN